ncbi:MAG: Na+/H+ antiporter [Alphaproteobacteria bacterium]|nr:MAG: Na+/H+ antiporter [Alphaproteobacteria bacterium]
MSTITIVLVMLLAVVISGFIGRMLPLAVPLPLIQIALGFFVAMVLGVDVTLDPEIFFLLFLPPLLFLDGWRIPKHTLLKDKWTILELSLGLVIFTVVGMGFFINWLIPAIPLGVAFALAAVLSPTDPVAVTSIASRVPIPKRIVNILEGESLLNDASGLVCLRFAIAAVLTGTFSLGDAALTFLWLALGGIAIGVGVTFGIMRVKALITQRFGEESGTQILVSLLIPFGAYLAAEHLHCSGILAAVAAGITMSYAELSGKALAATRVRRNVVWDTLQFAANGSIFVLLGEQLPRILKGASQTVREAGHYDIGWLLVYIVIITAGLVALRFVWVYASVHFTMLTKGSSTPMSHTTVLRLVGLMSVGGVRGAITLAGILTLPFVLTDGTPFPARDLAIFIAAGVIILSLLMATLVLPYLARNLHLPAQPVQGNDENIARAATATAAIHAVERALHLYTTGRTDADLYAGAAARVMGRYRSRLEESLKTGEEREYTKQVNAIERKLRGVALQAERDELVSLGRKRHITDDLMRRLLQELDLIEARDQ